MLLSVGGKLWVKCGSGFLGSRTTKLVGAPDSQARCAAGQAGAACTLGSRWVGSGHADGGGPKGCEAQEQAARLPECHRPERLGVGFPGWRATPPGRPVAVCLRVLLAQLVFTASCHEDPPFLPWPHVRVVPSGQLSDTTRYGVRVVPTPPRRALMPRVAVV